MTLAKALKTSSTSEWATPQDLFDKLNSEFGFTLDPCCTHETAKCNRYYTKEQNGLAHSWAGETVFMNPPYGKHVSKWIAKAHWEAEHKGATVVCLLPARTDTRWWHRHCINGEIRFIKGRLKFNGASGNAPFPSVVVIFTPPDIP